MAGTSLRPSLHGRRAARPVLSLASLLVAGSLTLTACGGGSGSPSAKKSPRAQGTAAGATLMGQWPLTGLPAKGPAPQHPVMIVKIDNTVSSRPQIGLSKADLITEELVEGGYTRLAVFYYSKVPQRVGPVRSMRATDIGIVKPAHAVLVASGGAPPTVRRIHAAGIHAVTEGGPGYARDSTRSAPYNLFMTLPALARTLKASAPPDHPYLPWGHAKDFPKGRPARRIAATFSGGHTTTWQYRKGSYVNLDSNAAAGDQFRPSTVLLLRVKVGDAGYRDPAGNPVPETHFYGTGPAMVFHGGRMVRATWKKSITSTVSLRTRSGHLGLPPGKVWMELVPANGGNVTFSQ